MAERIKITGYYTPDPDEAEDAATSGGTGLTEEAHIRLIGDEEGTGLKVADLEDVEVEVED